MSNRYIGINGLCQYNTAKEAYQDKIKDVLSKDLVYNTRYIDNYLINNYFCTYKNGVTEFNRDFDTP